MENATEKSCLLCNGKLESILPKCFSKFPMSADEKKGYFICASCGRSLGLGPNEEPVKRPWQ